MFPTVVYGLFPWLPGQGQQRSSAPAVNPAPSKTQQQNGNLSVAGKNSGFPLCSAKPQLKFKKDPFYKGLAQETLR